MNFASDKTDEVIVSASESLGISQRDAISKLKSRDSGIRKKADEVANNIANSELEKLGSTPNLNNSSYTEKTNNYEGMRERAPQFEKETNSTFKASFSLVLGKLAIVLIYSVPPYFELFFLYY